MTVAEKILWNELKNRQVFKTKFRRQHPIDIFIANFYCHEYKLLIEIDGEIHLRREIKEHDERRVLDIRHFGIKILRFTNHQIINGLDFVKKAILDELEEKSPL